VSAWALVEIGYAAEKRSNPLTTEDRSATLAELAAPDSPFDIVPVDAEIAVRVAGVPREVNADPGDRVLVATAEVLGARLVSADRMLPGGEQIVTLQVRVVLEDLVDGHAESQQFEEVLHRMAKTPSRSNPSNPFGNLSDVLHGQAAPASGDGSIVIRQYQRHEAG
jgi:PIN domain nuclease of toxin-antitoxin system